MASNCSDRAAGFTAADGAPFSHVPDAMTVKVHFSPWAVESDAGGAFWALGIAHAARMASTAIPMTCLFLITLFLRYNWPADANLGLRAGDACGIDDRGPHPVGAGSQAAGPDQDGVPLSVDIFSQRGRSATFQGIQGGRKR